MAKDSNSANTSKRDRKYQLVRFGMIFLICMGALLGLGFEINYAISQKWNIIITNDFLRSLISLSTSFMSIFGVLTLFAYREVDNNIEKYRSEIIKMEVPQGIDKNTGRYKADYESFEISINELKSRIRGLEKYKADSLKYFGMSIYLITISLGLALGKQLIEITEKDLGRIIAFVLLSTVPLFIGMGLMIYNIARLLTIER